MRLFVDTSGWYSFLVARESMHQAIRTLLLEKDHKLITSNAIFSELFTLLVARNHEAVGITFGERLRQGDECTVYRVSEVDEEKAWEILKERRGRGLSYTDATTIALMARLDVRDLVTLDRGFKEFDLNILP